MRWGAMVRAGHPEPSLAVTVVATVLAWSAGQPPRALLVLGAAVLSGQLSVGWSNDWLDAGRDRGRSDKPVPAGTVSVGAVRAAALTALPVALLLSLPSGPAATAVHAGALSCAWLYNLGLKATPLSIAPYALSFGLLPSFVTLPVSGWAPWWASAASALLGAGAHFTNTVPDLERDARTGVRGLPHRLGPRASRAAAGLLLSGGVAAIVAGTWPAGPVVVAAAAASLALVAAAALAGERPAAFRLTILAALAALTTFLAAGTALV